MGKSQVRKRREMLLKEFERNHKCRLCGCETRLVESKRHKDDPLDKAVLLHWHTRLMKTRNDSPDGSRRSDLVCKRCANDYGNGVQAMTPIKELQRRSGRYPQSMESPQ